MLLNYLFSQCNVIWWGPFKQGTHDFSAQTMLCFLKINQCFFLFKATVSATSGLNFGICLETTGLTLKMELLIKKACSAIRWLVLILFDLVLSLASHPSGRIVFSLDTH